MTDDLQPILRKPDAPILVRDADSVMKLGKTHRGREIWMGRQDLVRHTFVAGSTGSGKTELLLSMCANAIAVGSGLFMVDGKGDMSTFAKVMALAAEFGRQEDVLLLNMSQDTASGDGLRSHTVDILEGLSTPAVIQVLVSMLGQAGRSSDDMWTGRAIAMLTAVVRAVMWVRNSGLATVTLADMRTRMTLNRITDLADPARYPGMPAEIRAGVRTYLDSIPGYQFDKGYKQPQTALDQHGYLQMQTTRLFSSLVDDFGHLFSAGTHNVDMRDVVLNRRIVVVLLPALQKSPAEIANLGRVVVTLVKNMMASAMEAPVEGEWADILERRPTNGDQPFHVIFDEASHYIDDGMALMAAQARSLNFALTFAVQSISAMENANRGASAAILANTNTHVFMKGGIEKVQASFGGGYLPERSRHDAGAPDALEEEIKATVAEMRDNPVLLRARFGLELTPKHRSAAFRHHAALAETLRELDAEKADHLREYPAFDLMPEIKRLSSGEFIVVRSGQFLKGRSMFVSPDLGRPRIGLVRLVPHRTPERDLRDHYGRDLRVAAALERLMSPVPVAPEDVPPLGFDPTPITLREGLELDRFQHLVATFWMRAQEAATPAEPEEFVAL